MPYCTNNYSEVKQSQKAVCVYCKTEFLRTSPPRDLKDYEILHQPWRFICVPCESTVMCPHCMCDAIIGDATINWSKDDVDRWHNDGFSTLEL